MDKRLAVLGIAGLLLHGCAPAHPPDAPRAPVSQASPAAALAPIRVSGSYWIELVMLPRNTSANYFLVAMLRTVGLTEDDVVIVSLPPTQGDQTGMDQMSDALARGDVDAISIWEPDGRRCSSPCGSSPTCSTWLEEEEVWVARERGRTPRSREELARLIDRSVVDEALASD